MLARSVHGGIEVGHGLVRIVSTGNSLSAIKRASHPRRSYPTYQRTNFCTWNPTPRNRQLAQSDCSNGGTERNTDLDLSSARFEKVTIQFSPATYGQFGSRADVFEG